MILWTLGSLRSQSTNKTLLFSNLEKNTLLLHIVVLLPSPLLVLVNTITLFLLSILENSKLVLIFKNDSAASIFKLSSAKITLCFISLILGICPSKVIFSLASISSLFFILLSNICLKNIIIKPNINPPTKPNSVKRIKLGFSTSSGKLALSITSMPATFVILTTSSSNRLGIVLHIFIALSGFSSNIFTCMTSVLFNVSTSI